MDSLFPERAAFQEHKLTDAIVLDVVRELQVAPRLSARQFIVLMAALHVSHLKQATTKAVHDQLEPMLIKGQHASDLFVSGDVRRFFKTRFKQLALQSSARKAPRDQFFLHLCNVVLVVREDPPPLPMIDFVQTWDECEHVQLLAMAVQSRQSPIWLSLEVFAEEVAKLTPDHFRSGSVVLECCDRAECIYLRNLGWIPASSDDVEDWKVDDDEGKGDEKMDVVMVPETPPDKCPPPLTAAERQLSSDVATVKSVLKWRGKRGLDCHELVEILDDQPHRASAIWTDIGSEVVVSLSPAADALPIRFYWRTSVVVVEKDR
jgi:hypothetical protein